MNLFLISLLLFIEPQMSSKKASFDGKLCILEEDVVIDHPFGKLKTDKALLEKGDNEKLSFDKAWLENRVEVFLNSGAILKGSKAEANLEERILKFSGDVFYQELGGLKIYAQNAETKFVEKESKFLAQSVKASGLVKAFFPTGQSIYCDKVFYKPEEFFELHGNEDNACQLIDQDLDLKALSGKFDLKGENGSLIQVEAILSLPISGVKSVLKLKSEEVVFSEKTQIIQSDKPTWVDSEAYSLKSDLKQFKIKLGVNKQVEEALLNGLINITGPQGQKLECPGILKLHEGKQQLVLRAHKGSSITCQTNDLIIKSSKARLFYKQQMNKFIPIKIELEDQVELYDLREDRKIYGKAHQADIFLEEDRVHLFGDKQSRVLYIDESIDLNLSAPEVLIQKNALNKLSVQGLGAVRFSFNEDEEMLIDKLKNLGHE